MCTFAYKGNPRIVSVLIVAISRNAGLFETAFDKFGSELFSNKLSHRCKLPTNIDFICLSDFDWSKNILHAKHFQLNCYNINMFQHFAHHF